MATLVLTLNAKDIKYAVKADTYITGQIDKSADAVNNAMLAYNEQAGDDAYHDNKLYRTMKSGVGRFEASVAEFVDTGSGNVAVSDTLSASTADTQFTITIPVTSRFYAAFANALSVLAQDYVINMMLYTWWQSIKPTIAKNFYDLAQEALIMVRKTLSKTPPTAPTNGIADVTGTVS